MDYVTLRDLEITKSISGNDENTLFSFMNETSTPMGARLLRNWLITPTQQIKIINNRHNKLDWIFENKTNLYDLTEILKKISDLERLINRIENKTCNYRDLFSLYESISQLNILKKMFSGSPFKFNVVSKNLLPNHNIPLLNGFINQFINSIIIPYLFYDLESLFVS